MAAPQQQQMHMQQPGGGGVPHGHQHHGQHHGGQPQVLNVNVAQEKQHIAEHMAVPMDTSKMSEQELQFHYFKMHDADNNNKLDGCELIKSLIHWHGEETSNIPVHSDSDLQAMVDMVLKEVDKDNDGFVTYSEYKMSDYSV
ncbi:hypothetical protein AAG570_009248 [Ranatra chinensis]|uniref:EF-hand domain-containing protein n=1 Tax=Ranatra chinensis TaxID=642074 RepID=A0ABD0YVD2_9HEMI